MPKTYPEELKRLVFQLRQQYGWGPKQIKKYLEAQPNIKEIPDESTIKRWLRELKQEFDETQSKDEKVKEEIEAEKEELKSSAYKSQVSPTTAVDRQIKKEITEKATDLFSKDYLTGKKINELFEEKAKRYGFSDAVSYVIFLDEFYHKNKDLDLDYEKLLKEYKRLKENYKLLLAYVKLLKKKRSILEEYKRALLYKLIFEES